MMIVMGDRFFCRKKLDSMTLARWTGEALSQHMAKGSLLLPHETEDGEIKLGVHGRLRGWMSKVKLSGFMLFETNQSDEEGEESYTSCKIITRLHVDVVLGPALLALCVLVFCGLWIGIPSNLWPLIGIGMVITMFIEGLLVWHSIVSSGALLEGLILELKCRTD